VIEVEHRLVEPCHHGAEAEWSHAPRRLPPIAQRKMLLSLVRPLPEASSSLTPRWREMDSNYRSRFTYSLFRPPLVGSVTVPFAKMETYSQAMARQT
jgi:hypothetical protein